MSASLKYDIGFDCVYSHPNSTPCTYLEALEMCKSLHADTDILTLIAYILALFSCTRMVVQHSRRHLLRLMLLLLLRVYYDKLTACVS